MFQKFKKKNDKTVEISIPSDSKTDKRSHTPREVHVGPKILIDRNQVRGEPVWTSIRNRQIKSAREHQKSIQGVDPYIFLDGFRKYSPITSPRTQEIEKEHLEPLGFDTASPRFATLGLHPDMDTSGNMKGKSANLGPGRYNIDFFRCIDKTESPWKRSLAASEFSKYLGFRNKKILEEKEHQKTHLGPGLYQIPDDLDRQKSSSAVENRGFSSQKRFKSFVKDDQPPLGTYRRNIFEKPHTAKKQFGPVPSFEWDGIRPRFKYPPPKRTPSFYDIPDPKSMEALLKRVVSRRETYNLYTGSRDGSSIKNYFAPIKKITPDQYHVEPSDIDYLLYDSSKKRMGKFLLATRFPKKNSERICHAHLSSCYKNPLDPGPGHYDLSKETGFKTPHHCRYPFNSSCKHQKPPLPWCIHPGPGRYRIKRRRCRKRLRRSWIFRTKGTERIFFRKPESYMYLSEWIEYTSDEEKKKKEKEKRRQERKEQKQKEREERRQQGIEGEEGEEESSEESDEISGGSEYEEDIEESSTSVAVTRDSDESFYDEKTIVNDLFTEGVPEWCIKISPSMYIPQVVRKKEEEPEETISEVVRERHYHIPGSYDIKKHVCYPHKIKMPKEQRELRFRTAERSKKPKYSRSVKSKLAEPSIKHDKSRHSTTSASSEEEARGSTTNIRKFHIPGSIQVKKHSCYPGKTKPVKSKLSLITVKAAPKLKHQLFMFIRKLIYVQLFKYLKKPPRSKVVHKVKRQKPRKPRKFPPDWPCYTLNNDLQSSFLDLKYITALLQWMRYNRKHS